MIERVVLVGYLGSGKSVVGRALARRLDWAYAVSRSVGSRWGWITRPELLAALGSGTLTVWLQTSPSAAYDRILRSGIDHPLRALPDALDQMGEMMREREPLYNRADMAIPTDGRPVEAIAFEIEQLVRTRVF